MVEGAKLVAEVLGSDLDVLTVVAAEQWDPPVDWRPEVEYVEPHVLERIASTSTPQPVLAEVAVPLCDWGVWPANPSAVLVAVDLNDPGNLGTLARSAEAAGFDALVALGATTDPWGPKSVRAGAGAIFRLPVVVDADVEAGMDHLARRDMLRIGTRMVDAEPCDEVDLDRRVAVVMGSEAHGLGPEIARSIDAWVQIPMAGSIESLNVAMAGAILTYEVARQRRRNR